jgi:DNA-binding beta-propeller fold protein YncE
MGENLRQINGEKAPYNMDTCAISHMVSEIALFKDMKINKKSKKEATKMRSGRKIEGFFRAAGVSFFIIMLGLIYVPFGEATTISDVEMLGKIEADVSLLRSPGKLAYANGVLFVVDSYKNRIQTFDAMGNYLSMIGFARPSAVAAASDGTLYIGSNIDYSVAIYQNGTIIGYLGDGSYEFWSVSDVSLDSVTGNVYVADNIANAVFVYGAQGKKVRPIDGLNMPRSVEIVGDKVYVLDFPIVQLDDSSHSTVPRVSVYDRSGNELSSFYADGDPKEMSSSPTDISVHQDNIFISDATQKAVLVYDLTGTYVGTVTRPEGEINTAVSVAVSPEGVLYVSSSETHSIEMIRLGTRSGNMVNTGVVGGGQ